MRALILGLLIVLHTSLVTAADPDTTVPLIPSGASAYKVSVFVEGAGNMDFLVDTGAGYMTINEEVLAILQSKGLATHVRNMQGVLANGARMSVPLYRLSGINIGGVCALRNVEAAVFPGATRGLLGLNALAQTAPFMFSVEPPSLQMSNCQAVLHGDLVATN